MSEYLRGVVQVPIERKHLANAQRWARAVAGRYDAEVEVDEPSLYIIIKPGPNITVDGLLKLRDMARAIALGFTPEDALALENEGYYLDSIDLKEYVPPAHLPRVKARIIGEDGRAKSAVEGLAGVKIVVGDRRVAFLGPMEAVALAKEAVLMLIEGRKHSTVYRWLQRAKRG